jgi:hypothetical protein
MNDDSLLTVDRSRITVHCPRLTVQCSLFAFRSRRVRSDCLPVSLWTGVGWDKDFHDGTGLMTKLEAECGFESLGYNQEIP